ncbi:chorismate-binding protein [Cyclobacterium sp.]|uniref:chorismate-binding protein n=1 Tax=Cyclobacterium sp. TaxID=1966343 RepID=UPI0019B21022|nr:chorismate-binding protein [Cyclobacterium sp.]MBD3631205.1 chorismate-binding protein [Cyclobacterium sp.]
METTNKIAEITKALLLEHLLFRALHENLPIAIWKKPKQPLIEVIIDEDKEGIKQPGMDLDQLPPGFMIHPFLHSKDHQPFFIKATNYYRFSLDENDLSDDQFPIWENSNKELTVKIRDIIQSFPAGKKAKASRKSDFIQTVNKAIESIASGKLYKVVPARLKKMTLPSDFDLAGTFLALCDAYPNAFINCFYSESTGFWIGASPETLIKTRGDSFYTMALAGTQKAKGDNPLKNAAWTQKEIEEQALVSRYIVDCFKKIRLREYLELGPKTTIAGGLLHLKSEFLVDMKATNFPQLGSVMLELLHPTSAVCGMPKAEALELLETEENFDRSYFSGFIGPVNIEAETALYVNLRCAKLENKEVLLFAGAGVTEDSVPEKEWEETEMKCNIIGKIIKTNQSR